MKELIRCCSLSLIAALGGLSAHPAWAALECPLKKAVDVTLNLGTISLNDVSSNSTKVLWTSGQISAGTVDCSAGQGGADWYGWANNLTGVVSDSYKNTSGSTDYTYDRAFWPTNIPGIYYAVFVIGSKQYYPSIGEQPTYLPASASSTRIMDASASLGNETDMYIQVELWQRGQITGVGDAHPIQSGLLGTFRAGDGFNNPKMTINVTNSSFTVKFAAPTCNLSVSPATIDFGDVGNDKPRKTFTLKNSNCVNASGVTLKLTSAKAAYDNSGLSILANTTTGTSAAGGRGVAVSYEGSSRQYLSANDTNSSVSIDFGSIVTAKDITMAGLLTCTSASNNSTCDDYTPGAFTAVGTLSATYK